MQGSVELSVAYLFCQVHGPAAFEGQGHEKE